jgi:hypothetical protein
VTNTTFPRSSAVHKAAVVRHLGAEGKALRGAALERGAGDAWKRAPPAVEQRETGEGILRNQSPATVTNRNEYALLTLAAVRPLRKLPKFHKAIADRLASKGLLRQADGAWHPTAAGLRVIHQTLH